MNRLALVAMLAATCAGPAFAGGDVVRITLQSVLDMPEAKAKLDGSVRFYLAGSPTPRILKTGGDDFANEKTTSSASNNERTCRWVTLSDLISFQARAKQMGANAVVDMVSYYHRQVVSDPAEIECHLGPFVTGVALKGVYARIAP
jgi:hypothetical protein